MSSLSCDEARVRAWREQVVIPTYGIGAPNRNPMFLDRRVYQGSSGAVYPLPVIESIEDEKHDRGWSAVFLENEFLRIMILPELGGRVQMALDKSSDYHFVYYNRVIKPALVGLTGPWISGGIEFNWPQHHRPSTFMPLDCELEVDDDGDAATVWLHEIDRMHRTESTHAFTLRRGRAVLEIDVRIYNRTELPQTFLWWANPAVHADQNHQSVFPPDVSAVMDHGRRDVSPFPIATGTYYKVDYSPGTDISRYRNIPVPTSYMAHHSDYDFVGSYDHGRGAGLLHVCNHHISPGKKQWTWGTAEFGQAWQRHLTDTDGPYVELMCGVYTDNQPDFSWLMPGEAKSFKQYFLPYRGVGIVGNATIEAATGLEFIDDGVIVRAYTSSPRPAARAMLTAGGQRFWETTFDGAPGSSFERSVRLPADVSPTDVSVEIVSAEGDRLVDWKVPSAVESDNSESEIPEPAVAIALPAQLDSVESLYLAGMHLEQYRHATREPEDYYREGARRDRGDARCNLALGRLLYRRGRFADAEPYLRRSIERQTRHNPNPYDGEAHFLLGCALERLSRFDQAYGAYHKAVWNAAWQDAGYYALARLDCRARRFDVALENVDRCLDRNRSHRQARHLKLVLLRLLRRHGEAESLARDWLRKDPFQAGLIAEGFAGRGEIDVDADRFISQMRDDQHNYVELALDYAAAGLEARATRILQQYLKRVAQRPETPIVYYLLADFHEQAGEVERAREVRRTAAQYRPDYCFPNRLEEIGPLRRAAAADPQDAKASYYLGNLWYDRRQHDLAISCWQQSRDRDPSLATVWRNLGLAYFNKRHDAETAWNAYGEAFRRDESDARVLFELDQLAKRLGHPPSQRLQRLDCYRDLVSERDDLTLEYVTLLNILGHHRQALEIMLARNFHPWEGGEGKVPTQYTLCLTELARAAIARGDFETALQRLDQAMQWPQCLGEGKLPGNRENHIHYWRGVVHRRLGRQADAAAALERSSTGTSQPSDSMYYNDQPPEMVFYQGLALHALGQTIDAVHRFEGLVDYGRTHGSDHPEIDFFAVSLPDFLVFEEDLTRRNEIHCRFMLALGMLGLRRFDEAGRNLDQILAVDPSHLGAVVHHRRAEHAETLWQDEEK